MRYFLFAMTGLLFASVVIAQDDAKTLEGTYALVGGEVKGEKIPESVLKASSNINKGNTHNVKMVDESFIGTHKLDPNKTPKEIDSTDTEGPLKGKSYLGIYKLENGVWTVCFAAPGKDRPKEFTTKSGTGELMHVWKKK